MQEPQYKKQGEVKPIHTLFERYKKVLRAPQGSVVKEFCVVVEEVLSVPLKKEHVDYNVNTRVLVVRAPGPFKQEILFQKEKILARCEDRLGSKGAPKQII